MTTELAKHQLQHLGARQAFQVLRGSNAPTPQDIATPEPCSLPAPPEPNAYTDGSLKQPTEPDFCLGGGGTWYPCRDLEQTGASEAEANIATFEQELGGLKLYNHAPGYGGSSTRMEIQGAITALAAKGPTHMATDSQAFRSKALAIHRQVDAHSKPKKPWALQHDGDLWHLYHRFVSAKTTQAIDITKVKGHATTDMVASGKVRAEDKLGNDKADEAAAEGVALFGHPTVSMGRWYGKRHKYYTYFVSGLLEHLVFTFQVRAALLQVQRAGTPPTAGASASPTESKPTTTITAPTPQPYAQHLHQHFTHIMKVQQFPQLCQRHPCIGNIQAFLGDMPYTPVELGSRAPGSLTAGSADSVEHHPPDGITWLELYTLYRMAGWPEPLAQPSLLAAPKPTLRQQLQAFRQATRQLVHSTMPADMQTLFKGHGSITGKRLAGLGVNTFLAVLPWQPCLTLQAHSKVATEILRSQYRLTHAKAGKAIAEHTRLPLRSIQLNGRTHWSRTIRYSREPLYTHPHPSPPKPSSSASTCPADFQPEAGEPPSKQQRRAGAAAPSDRLAPSLPSIVFFKCPRCPHQVSGTKQAFHLQNMDARVWCNACQRSLFTRHWRCACGLPWHTCPLHQGEPDRLRNLQPTQTSSAPNPPPRPKPTRRLGEGRDERILQWVDQPSAKRRRQDTSEVDLTSSRSSEAPKRPNLHCLGPKLLAKFPRLQQQGGEQQQSEPAEQQPPTQQEGQRPRTELTNNHAQPLPPGVHFGSLIDGETAGPGNDPDVPQ